MFLITVAILLAALMVPMVSLKPTVKVSTHEAI